MDEIILDETLQKLNDRLVRINEISETHNKVFALLRKEVQAIDFEAVFKDEALLKDVFRIMTSKEEIQIYGDQLTNGNHGKEDALSNSV